MKALSTFKRHNNNINNLQYRHSFQTNCFVWTSLNWYKITSQHCIKVINGYTAIWRESISPILVLLQANHIWAHHLGSNRSGFIKQWPLQSSQTSSIKSIKSPQRKWGLMLVTKCRRFSLKWVLMSISISELPKAFKIFHICQVCKDCDTGILRSNLSLRLQKLFWVLFCGLKESGSLSSTFDNCTSSFFLSLCECWHLQDIVPHFKLFRHSHSPTEACCRVTGEDSSTTHYFSKNVWCENWICSWLHIAVREVMQEKGLPGRQPKAHNTGDESLCCADTVKLQQLIMWKENITILFFPMTEGENFLQVRCRFQQTRGFHWIEKAGGNFWDLNTKLSWQALKEELGEPLYCWTKEGGG